VNLRGRRDHCGFTWIFRRNWDDNLHDARFIAPKITFRISFGVSLRTDPFAVASSTSKDQPLPQCLWAEMIGQWPLQALFRHTMATPEAFDRREQMRRLCGFVGIIDIQSTADSISPADLVEIKDVAYFRIQFVGGLQFAAPVIQQ
jgi:hypothetical protein